MHNYHSIKNGTGSGGLGGLEKETATGCQPENNFAAGFPPVKITLGKKDADSGPDTALASGGIQRVHDMIYMAPLFISNCLENINLDWGGHK